MTIRDDAAGGVSFDILVTPRASRAKLGPLHDGRLKVAVTAPPVDGEANAAVIELIAKALGIAKTAVSVIGGASSRISRFELTSSADRLLARRRSEDD